MNIQEKIDFIYKKIADKKIFQWTKIIKKEFFIESKEISVNKTEYIVICPVDFFDSQYTRIIENEFYCYKADFDWFETEVKLEKIKIENKWNIEYEVIWHPVMIWDIFDYISRKLVAKIFHSPNTSEEADELWKIASEFVEKKFLEITLLYDYKRLPIENQSDECIDFIYNLL